MGELHDLTAIEQRDALRNRVVSASDLLEHYLDRIDRYGSELGAFVTRTDDLARREAAAADRLLASGDPDELPPLLGLPLAFKDLHPVAGVRTTMGSAALADFVPTEDAHTVGLLRRAGVVTVGTTHAPEFGVPCYTQTAVVERPAVTPYDTSRYSAGSSGGAAAAVAAGLLPFGHASDGAGSTRLPASVCGLVGIKATRGLVSLAPTASFESWGSEGPLARTVADAALLLDVMAAAPPSDLHGVTRETSYLDAAGRDPQRPLRVLSYTDGGLDTDPDPEVVRAVDQTAALLRELGHEVTVTRNPQPFDDGLLADIQLDMSARLAAGVQLAVPRARQHLLLPLSTWLIAFAERMSSVDHAAALGRLASGAAAHLKAAAEYDAVLTPVTSAPAVQVGAFSEEGLEQEPRRMLRWAAFCPWANMSGLPAIALPAGRTQTGLPLGVQLVGARRGQDAALISLAGQLERARPFSHVHPPQW